MAILAVLARESKTADKHTRTIGKIANNANRSEAGLPSILCCVIKAGLMQLADKRSATLERNASPAQKTAKQLESISSAVKRQLRLEVRHLTRHRGKDLSGNVGWIGNNKVESAEIALGDRISQIAFENLHLFGELKSSHVFTGEGNRQRRKVGRDDARVAALRRDRTRNAPGPRADIRHKEKRIIRLLAIGGLLRIEDIIALAIWYLFSLAISAFRDERFTNALFQLSDSRSFSLERFRIPCGFTFGCSRKTGKRLADKHFGFRTRNQNTGSNLHRQITERSLPGDVLKRLALPAAQDIPMKQIELGAIKRSLGIHVQVDASKRANLR